VLARVDLGALAADAVADARVTVPDRHIELTVDGDTAVSGDENQLRELLQNLIRNALVHTPPGTEIAVRVRRDGDQVELVVADDGPGMDEATAGRVFERFFRADKARSPGTGTGLGLSIVRSIVLAHGGTVDLLTRPAEGSAFTVRLSSAS
jgi:two-component system OmpR family sensor kinase